MNWNLVFIKIKVKVIILCYKKELNERFILSDILFATFMGNRNDQESVYMRQSHKIGSRGGDASPCPRQGGVI